MPELWPISTRDTAIPLFFGQYYNKVRTKGNFPYQTEGTVLPVESDKEIAIQENCPLGHLVANISEILFVEI